MNGALAVPAEAAFVRSDMDTVDHERLLDTEYFLDLASFAAPLAWESDLRRSTSPVVYKINAASLDCCDLYMDQQARLVRDLTKGLTFRFLFTQRGDKDKDETHHWLELEQRLPYGFSALLFGEPTFNKEDSDVGAGLGWGPLKVRRTFVDFNFNERGPAGESYSERPITDTVLLSGADALAYAEVDHPTRRGQFFYRRTVAGVEWRPEDWVLGWSYEYQRKADGLGLDNKRWAHYFQAGRRWRELEGGARLVNRRSRNLGGVFYRRWEAEPYARWRRELSKLVDSELATFLAFGEKETDAIIEAKLGAGFDFKFGPQGRIGVYGTFDLDELGGHFWDGGNVRAMFFF